MFSGNHLSGPYKTLEENTRKIGLQENQQLDFQIKLPIKIANQELERTGATPLPYFLRTQLHPWETEAQSRGSHDASRMWWYARPQPVGGVARLWNVRLLGVL